MLDILLRDMLRGQLLLHGKCRCVCFGQGHMHAKVHTRAAHALPWYASHVMAGS